MARESKPERSSQVPRQENYVEGPEASIDPPKDARTSDR